MPASPSPASPAPGAPLTEAQLRELAAREPGRVDAWARLGLLESQRGRHAEALTALQAALQRHRARRSAYEAARVYGWMAAAHRGVGAHHLAAADEAAAAQLYRRLGIEVARGHGTR